MTPPRKNWYYIWEWTTGAQSLVYMATFRPFTVTWGALMKSSKCQTIREPRSPSRPMTPQCHQVLVAERLTGGPPICGGEREKVRKQNHGHTLRLCGVCRTEWRWNTRSYGFRLTEGFKTRQVLLKVSIKEDWQGPPMCSDRRSCHSLIDAQRTWMESSEVTKKTKNKKNPNDNAEVEALKSLTNNSLKKVFHGIKYEMERTISPKLHSKVNFPSEIWTCRL